MWCSCGYKAGVWYDLTGQTNKLQVCGECRKPFRAYFQNFTAMRAPKDAEALLHIRSRKDGINELTFACKGGERKTVFFVGKNPEMLFELWRMLDQAIDGIKSPVTNDEYYYDRARARAFCDAISLVMPLNPDEVGFEALRRYDAKTAGTEYETPGLAEEVYVPAGTTGTKRGTGNRIPEGGVNSSKQGIELGMFTVAQIAKTYDMTIDEVKSQLGLA